MADGRHQRDVTGNLSRRHKSLRRATEMMKDKHGRRRRGTRIPEFAHSRFCWFLATGLLRGPRRAVRGAVVVGKWPLCTFNAFNAARDSSSNGALSKSTRELWRHVWVDLDVCCHGFNDEEAKRRPRTPPLCAAPINHSRGPTPRRENNNCTLRFRRRAWREGGAPWVISGSGCLPLAPTPLAFLRQINTPFRTPVQRAATGAD